MIDLEPGSFHYELSIKLQNGHQFQILDPYSFGPVLSEYDLFLLGKGTHYDLYWKLGANVITHENVQGTHFAVWAPNAQSVRVVGDFNSWDGRRHPMRNRGSSGIWEIFIPNLGEHELYKFEICAQDGSVFTKMDPIAKFSELRPGKASETVDISGYTWQDHDWISNRDATDWNSKPISIYEVHAGSWQRKVEEDNRFLSYSELADTLVPYLLEMGYTHVELMPLMEHPLDESWGYQVTGYFATTSRYGNPKELMYFVDTCHKNGIGVLLDWVPAHFPMDAEGLGRFDGQALYEHADPRQGEHPHWGTYIFNYGRNEVSNFLIASALFWLKEFHIDGLRVDAVASMLYLDYGKEEGQWIPNRDGGHINYDALEFIKHLNSIVRNRLPGALMIAEESTSFPCITGEAEHGCLGFHLKWNMGWMNDFLSYMSKEPVHRRWHHNNLTFSMIYAYSENFALVLSHDEVVHGKGSMIGKMPGDAWQQFANLRAAYGYMMAHPGKKLMFMGSDFAQGKEWNSSTSLDWHQCGEPLHAGVKEAVKNLNHIYKNEPALWEQDTKPEGFEWVECDDADNSVLFFLRKSANEKDIILIAANFTPVPRENFRVGVPREGFWKEIFNSDSALFGGSNIGNSGGLHSQNVFWQRQNHSLLMTLPPLSVCYFKWQQ